ncbi:IS5/IS1182 family transposase, partial [Acinetobacter colistiniresistens]
MVCTTTRQANQALIKRGNISIWFDPKTQWYAQPQGK